MNSAIAFQKRQMGNGKPAHLSDYDIAIEKLECLKLDEYKIAHNERDGPDPPILACKFAEVPSNKHILALANEDGAIAIQNINTRTTLSVDETPQIEGTVGHYNAIFDLAWKSDDMKLVTASGDHTIRLWDVCGSDIREERIFMGHDRSVKTVAFQNNSSVFASGGRDSYICIWDTRALASGIVSIRPDSVIDCSQISAPKSTSKKKAKPTWWCPSRMNSITGLVFQDDNTLISCSAGDGAIRCWDVRKTFTIQNKNPIPKYTLPYMGSSSRKGYTNLLVDQSAVRLYASCLDNVIYCYNISSYSDKPVMMYTGHQISNSFYVKTSLSPDSRYLISGSCDEKAYIWNVRQQKPLVMLDGHDAEVTCVAWCQNGELVLITCSDDSKHKVWRVRDDYSEKSSVIGSTIPVQHQDNSCLGDDVHEPCAKRFKSSEIDCHKHKMLCPNEFEPSSKRPRLLFNTPTSDRKRLLPDTDESSAKRARRLFNNTEQTTDPTDITSLATILEENSINDNKTSDLASKFTENLPNFVVDGTAPHLRIISPEKRTENKDWISKIRKEKEIRRRMAEELGVAGPSSPKYPKLDANSDVKSNGIVKQLKMKTPNRRISKDHSETPPRAQSPLLKYFKVTAANNVIPPKDCSSSVSLSPVATPVTSTVV